MKDINYYVCKHCGNVIGKIIDNKVKVVCCGEPMQELIPNTSDGANEKHVPVITRDGNKVKVSVGSVAHPMMNEHFIVWITLVHGNRRESVFLKPGDMPVAEFYAEEEELTAYEYCNLHGLWKADFKGR